MPGVIYILGRNLCGLVATNGVFGIELVVMLLKTLRANQPSNLRLSKALLISMTAKTSTRLMAYN